MNDGFIPFAYHYFLQARKGLSMFISENRLSVQPIKQVNKSSMKSQINWGTALVIALAVAAGSLIAIYGNQFINKAKTVPPATKDTK